MQFGFKGTFDNRESKQTNEFVMVMESFDSKKKSKGKTIKLLKDIKKAVIIGILKSLVSACGFFVNSAKWMGNATKSGLEYLGCISAQIKPKISSFIKKLLVIFESVLMFENTDVNYKFKKPSIDLIWRKTSRKMKNKFKSARTYAKDINNRPIIAMGATIATITMLLVVLGMNFAIAFEAVVDTKTIALVHSKKEFKEAMSTVNTELVEYFGEEGLINKQPVYLPRLVSRSSFSSMEEIKNSIRMLSDKMVDAYVVCVEDEPLFAMMSEDEISEAVEKFKACYTGGNSDMQVELDKPIKIIEQTVPVVMLKDVEGAVNRLNGSERKDLEYSVLSGDNLWSISRKFGISLEQLYSINPGLSENINEGQKILVKAFVPIIDIKTIHQAQYNKTIPFETKTIEDANVYRGTTRVKQDGKNGEEVVVANVIRKNGLEVEREIVNSEVISQPVEMIRIVGTKTPPSGYGTGKFIMPTYGTITSRFGPRRGGYHKGLDIAAATGTPIRAADNGRVVHSGWKGLFGNLVVLNHGNGYESYYGHCSKLAVKVGQTVNKGDIIAYVGSTGNSSGPHVHFEVYHNGALKNHEKLPFK